MIRFEHLKKSFGGQPALREISFEVGAGEIFGVLGHNGAGKSTAFGIALGHVHADAGRVLINGHNVATDRARALSGVGAIFETPSFYDYLSGWRNLRFLVSLSGPVSKARCMEVVEAVGLGERIHDPVRTYSHGMRQRLALAQALLPDPALIILDEPTEGLDPAGIQEMRTMILRLRDEHGKTIILSSHLLHEVEQLCDRIAILNRGSLVFCGHWEDARPARWFIGTSDKGAKEAVIEKLGGRVLPDGSCTIPDGLGPADVLRELVIAGVRVTEFRRAERTLEAFYLETTA